MNKAITAFFLLPVLLFAQASFELDAHYGFGASELAFNSVPGFAVSIYPVKNFGVSFGLEYSWRWQSRTSEQSGTNPIAIDSDGDSLIFGYKINEYEEKLHGEILQIPILLKYSNDFFYTAAGIKIGLPQKAKANVKYDSLKTWGYYPEYHLTLTEPLFQGFGEQKGSAFKTKISSPKTLLMLALEGGVKLKLSDNFSLAAGVFADYSLNKSFSRSLPVIERVENKNSSGASIVVNDAWKSWRPWSIGAVVKFSFLYKTKNIESGEDTTSLEQETQKSIPVDTTHRIVVKPPPVVPQMSQNDTLPSDTLPSDTLLPKFLLNKEADFVFNYPETRTNQSDSLHLFLFSQIADTLRARPDLKLHCVGYSENLLSEEVADETAYQRVLRIRYALSNFYGINESRIFIYSQGSKSTGYRRAECFVQ